MAELVDAPDLGSGAYGVGVRVPSPAPLFLHKYLILLNNNFTKTVSGTISGTFRISIQEDASGRLRAGLI